jgi:hypothetical protein
MRLASLRRLVVQALQSAQNSAYRYGWLVKRMLSRLPACRRKMCADSNMCSGNILIDGKFIPCHYFQWPHFSNLPLREMLRPFQHSIME